MRQQWIITISHSYYYLTRSQRDINELLLSHKTSMSQQHFTISQRDLQWIINISQDLRGRLIHYHFHKIWEVTSMSHHQFIRPQRETTINDHHLTRSIRKISTSHPQKLSKRYHWFITISQDLKMRHQQIITTRSQRERERHQWAITISQDLRDIRESSLSF